MRRVSETAINIGYSCRLLTEEMEEPFIIDADSFEEVEAQLRKALEDIDKMKNGKPNDGVVIANGQGAHYNGANGNVAIPDEYGEFAVVINGHSLVRRRFVLLDLAYY